MTAQPGSVSRGRRIRARPHPVALHALSWAARRRGDRRRGIALSAAGYGIATFSAWLGGHLSFGKGVGVNQTAFEAGPGDWTPVLDEATLEERKLTGARTDGVAVLLVRKGATRLRARRPLLAPRLRPARGRLNDDDTVTCRCHGSTFRLDGSIVKGPATARHPSFETRTRKGKIEIRRPPSAA